MKIPHTQYIQILIQNKSSQCGKIRCQQEEKKNYYNTNIGRINNTLLNNQQIMEEIKKEINIRIEANENESKTAQNLWDSVKAAQRWKFIVIQAYLRKQEKHQINNLTLHLNQLEKEE